MKVWIKENTKVQCDGVLKLERGEYKMAKCKNCNQPIGEVMNGTIHLNAILGNSSEKDCEKPEYKEGEGW